MGCAAGAAAALALIAILVGAWVATPGAWAQEPEQATIEISSQDPCFLNATHPHRVIANCGAKDDWLAFALAPWGYVTGGLMSMMIVGTLVIVVWAKYRQAIYPIFIGVVMLPVSWFLFPAQFLSFALLLMAIAIGAYIWWAVTRQTE